MILHKLFGKKKPDQKVLVLMYHKIEEPAFDPWDLSVSPANFEAQLSWLQKKYPVISMRQLLDFIQGGEIPGPAVCLSFDDAYLDNYEIALPLLVKYTLPACFFVPGYFVAQQTPFWWDELTEIVFSQATSSAGNMAVWNSWRWPDPPPDQYCSQLIKSWEELRSMPYSAIRFELEKLKQSIGTTAGAKSKLMPMTANQLTLAGNSGLVSSGIHTQTHLYLPDHPKEVQQKEITQNQQWLRQFPGAMPNIIAYPYGAYNNDTLMVVKEEGIQLGFTTKAQAVLRGTAALELGRFQVKNWSTPEFEDQLANWFANY